MSQGVPDDPGRGRADADDVPPAAPPVETPPAGEECRPCWRCGKPAPVSASRCPHCEAGLGAPAPAVPMTRRPGDLESAVTALLWMYGVLLVASVGYGWVIRFGLRPEWSEGQPDRLWYAIVAFEALDTVLVLAGLFVVGRPPPLPRVRRSVRLASWLALPLLLGGMLGINIGFHWCLRVLIGRELPPEAPESISLATIVTSCVQPAVVEELFMRYLALGTLRRVLGMHGAVWVSAVMFGMAHIFVPLSIPMLTAAGVVLGYARLGSRGMALPIGLHFLHNLSILLLHQGF